MRVDECANCHYMMMLGSDGWCHDCNPDNDAVRPESKPRRVEDELVEFLSQALKRDDIQVGAHERVLNTECGNYRRSDIVIPVDARTKAASDAFAHYIVIVEADEHQHWYGDYVPLSHRLLPLSEHAVKLLPQSFRKRHGNKRFANALCVRLF